jgi:hypothetical protein
MLPVKKKIQKKTNKKFYPKIASSQYCQYILNYGLKKGTNSLSETGKC